MHHERILPRISGKHRKQLIIFGLEVGCTFALPSSSTSETNIYFHWCTMQGDVISELHCGLAMQESTQSPNPTALRSADSSHQAPRAPKHRPAAWRGPWAPKLLLGAVRQEQNALCHNNINKHCLFFLVSSALWPPITQEWQQPQHRHCCRHCCFPCSGATSCAVRTLFETWQGFNGIFFTPY